MTLLTETISSAPAVPTTLAPPRWAVEWATRDVGVIRDATVFAAPTIFDAPNTPGQRPGSREEAGALPWRGPPDRRENTANVDGRESNVVVDASCGFTVTTRTAPGATLVSVVVHPSRGPADAFEADVARAYAAVRSAVVASPHAQVVRMWNHVPGIHDRMTGDRDRYMAFNAARYAAMSAWYGDDLRPSVPAASGVGHDGDALVVHALALAAPGRPVENPGQVPALQYSAKFGPRPPCFARGTAVDVPNAPGESVVLIAGTAAITGEESQFGDDLARQFALSARNMSVVIARALPARPQPSPELLWTMRHVRVYVPPTVAPQTASDLAAATFIGVADIQIVPADLCRRELLIEIEGVAALT